MWGVRECAGVCASVRGCVHGSVRVCAGVGGSAWVCVGVPGCAWIWDVFSEFFLENRVPTSADFNTFPIRIFYLHISYYYYVQCIFMKFCQTTVDVFLA